MLTAYAAILSALDLYEETVEINKEILAYDNRNEPSYAGLWNSYISLDRLDEAFCLCGISYKHWPTPLKKQLYEYLWNQKERKNNHS